MKHTNKKGFTIVELVIVIAVIAILAAVLIPTFSNLIKKANESNDKALVTHLNKAIFRPEGAYETMQEVVDAVAEAGFDITKIAASVNDNNILWDMDEQKFIYSKDEPENPDATLWIISDTISTVYSTYYYGGNSIDSATTTTICIATNGADLTVKAPNADVQHFGDVANLTIEEVKDASYHEFGRVTQLAIVKKGHVKIENGGSIGTLVVATSEVKLTGSFGLIMGTAEVLDSITIPEGATSQQVAGTDDLEGKVAIVNGTFYADFSEAITAANGGTVVLVRDVKFAANNVFTIQKGETVTIDLNGHAIMATAAENGTAAVITNKGTLTIKDSVGGGKITTNALNPDMKPIPGYASNTIKNEGTLTLESGTIENDTNAPAAFAVDNYQGSTFTMNGGNLVAERCALRMFCNSETLAINVTINGGEISGGTRAIWIQLPGNDNAKAAAGNLTINGGTFDGGTGLAVYSYTYGNNHTATSITITGGTFKTGVAFGGGTYKGTQETVSVTGGTFNAELGRYLENDGWVDITKP